MILTCFGGAGIWAYIIAAIIIPEKITESQDQSVIDRSLTGIRQAAKRVTNIRLNEADIKIKKTAHTQEKSVWAVF